MDLLAQLGLGLMIGFTGAAIPGPLMTFVVANGLSGRGRFNGIFSATGHCIVEAVIIAVILLGFLTVLDAAPIRLLNVIGGASLILFGAVPILGRGAESKVGLDGKENALLSGAILSIFNGTVLLWWATVGLQQLGFAMRSVGWIGAVFWIIGHWSADLSWYGLMGYYSFKGRILFTKTNLRRIELGSSTAMILIGILFTLLSIFA
jgi:threonine/homoserine/homoserine lactone efflux protein